MIEYVFAFLLFITTVLHAAFALDVYKSYFTLGKAAQVKYTKHFTDAERFTRIFSTKPSTCLLVLTIGAMIVPQEDRIFYAALAVYMAVRVTIWSFFVKHQSVFQFRTTLK